MASRFPSMPELRMDLGESQIGSDDDEEFNAKLISVMMKFKHAKTELDIGKKRY